MEFGPALHKILKKKYPPNTRLDQKFRDNDITLVTDEDGDPVRFFIGKRKENGNIAGQRYTRTKIKTEEGKTLKDHWDLKGKTN